MAPPSELIQYPPVISLPEASITTPNITVPNEFNPSDILTPTFATQADYQHPTNPIPTYFPVLPPQFPTTPVGIHTSAAYATIPATQSDYQHPTNPVPTPFPILPPQDPIPSTSFGIHTGAAYATIPTGEIPPSTQPCLNCGIFDQMVKNLTKDPKKPKGGRPTREKALREAFKFI